MKNNKAASSDDDKEARSQGPQMAADNAKQLLHGK